MREPGLRRWLAKEDGRHGEEGIGFGRVRRVVLSALETIILMKKVLNR